MNYHIGFDVGSTTIKAVVIDDKGNICYKSYERHFSKVRQKALDKLYELKEFTKDEFTFAFSGSGALGLSEEGNIPFVQEVFASAAACKRYYPDVDAAIELGGEDAKILFFKGSIEQRMNSTCAGGTGAFIDQMASLLNISLDEMNKMAAKHEKIYPIASRCGVFAKTDVQPLINQGVAKSDLSASIFQAVVDQTITSLAQGRKIEGRVMFLGGPLFFLDSLRDLFIKTLKLKEEDVIVPETAINFVALGAALCSEKKYSFEELEKELLKLIQMPSKIALTEPLFENDAAYQMFKERHHIHDANYQPLKDAHGKTYLGIDSGSTTTKLVLLNENHDILYESYSSNKGNPLDVVKEDLISIYNEAPDDMVIVGAYATGYGEELMRHAFKLDGGIVETMAHYTAAKLFNPNVDFILDIGGQDIKCFRIRDGRIDDIVLNEACSSGCGSFIETFAKSMGYSSKEFAGLALKAEHPVELGTRCTVFMNSGVKQAQKNGATINDISAGLCRSVVKNALYKVIRAKSRDDIGDNIVVQGGTFLNDAVLRSFEQELNKEVIRPSIAHLMGAYGAALYAENNSNGKSSILNKEEINLFSHSSRSTSCGGCTNHCSLTINTFNDGTVMVAGNKCDRMIPLAQRHKNLPDMYDIKTKLLNEEKNKYHHEKKIGMPLVLNNYDLLPFWNAFFDVLNMEVVWSSPSTKSMYRSAQQNIPSDTACFPAKLVHGHIDELIKEKNVDVIFYPCMTYNIDEHQSDNHYNCPLVAYYPEVIAGNSDLNDVKFVYPYLSFDNPLSFCKAIANHFKKIGITFKKHDLHKAFTKGEENYIRFKNMLLKKQEETIAYARSNHYPIALLCGRPYHLDPLINHQINHLLTQLGYVVISEESVPHDGSYKVNVLNQWTYHARLYRAAYYASQNRDVELIQLVSFGCGIDAITTDEVKEILRANNHFYTQIKIDEIDNLGAVKIRLRSMKETTKRGKK